MKRRAVVSGANGFVGSAVVRSLLENDYEVYALVHSSRANLPEDKNLFVMQYDGSQTTMEIPEADYFFHFAWEGMTGKKRSDIGVQMGNLEMTRNAMKLAKNTGCRRFIGCGSIMEDESMAGINNPEFLPSPGHIYGFVKMLCRYYCKMYAIENGMGYVCGRLTNTYGPGEVSNRLICDLIRCLLNGNPKELSSCIQNYDFIYIDDVADAFVSIAEKGKNLQNYVVSSGEPRRLSDYLGTIGDMIGRSDLLHYGSLPPGINLDVSSFDNSSLLNDTGFRPKVGFEEGIKRTIEWNRGQLSV